jgi:hypothetical protein
MKDPTKPGAQKASDAEKQAGIKAYENAVNGGNIWYEMLPRVSDAMLKGWKANPNTYYIARPACGTHAGKMGFQFPDKHIFPMFKVTGLIMGIYIKKSELVEKSWRPNDGIVNVPSMGAPAGVEEIQVTRNDTLKKGIWQVMPPQNWDHQGWAGMFINKTEYYGVMDDVLESVFALPD